VKYAREKTPEGMAAIIAHSTGCITVANAVNSLIKDMPLFLISPVFNFKLYFLKRLASLNFPGELIKHYAAQFSNSYKQEFGKLELSRKLPQYADVTVIAHDQSDKTCPIAETIKFCDTYPLTKLLATKEYGHERIINSESVWQELKSHLNYEDTTINFIGQFQTR
jgi:hypothetical protein